MPLKRCTQSNGKSGWKYGDSGKCMSKRDAIKQMVAINMSQKKSGKTPEWDKSDLFDSVAEYLDPELARLNAIAAQNLSDSEIDLAISGHGTWRYTCGHTHNCRCSHSNLLFSVNSPCPDCQPSA